MTPYYVVKSDLRTFKKLNGNEVLLLEASIKPKLK